MDQGWLNSLLEWIRLNPGWFSAAICFVAFAESLAIVGLLMPGALILFGFGTLVGIGVLDLTTAWVWCTLGAIAGDGMSFVLGRHFQDRLGEVWPFSRYEKLVSRGRAFFAKHGVKSIFIGRFVGPVRPIIPVTAGAMRMPWRKYVPTNLLASVLWAPAYLLPGVAFGRSIELAAAVAARLALLLLLIVTTGWLVIWLVARIYNLLAPRASAMASRALIWLQMHPRLGRLASPLVDPTRPESGSLALMAILLLLAGWGFFALAIAVPIAQGPLAIDLATERLMESLRIPLADPLISLMAAVGHMTVVMPASIILLGWLVWRERYAAALHWVAAVGFGLLLSALLNFSLSLPRPLPESAFSLTGLGGLHTGLSVSVYGFLGVLLARELPNRDRVWPYALAALMVAAVVFANLYFGAFWLSDLVAMVLLATAWVALLGLAYRRRVRRSFWMVPPAFAFYLSTLMALGAQAYFSSGTVQAERGREPAVLVNAQQWWERSWQQLPDRRSRVGPGARVHLNVQFSGDPTRLADTLMNAGWHPPVTIDLTSVLQYLRPQPEGAELPILPGTFQGTAETLVLTRFTEDKKTMLALRLWESGRQLAGESTPLLIGSLGRYRVATDLYFFSHWAYENPHHEFVLDDCAYEQKVKQVAKRTVTLVRNIPATDRR